MPDPTKNGQKKSSLRRSKPDKTVNDGSSAPKRSSRVIFGSFLSKGDKKNERRSSGNLEEIDEVDPVIELLEARTTQRVRFTLDESEEAAPSKPTEEKSSHKASDRDPPVSSHRATFNIGSFMRRNLFHKGSQSKEDLEEEEQDPELVEAKKSTMIWESHEKGESSDFVHTSVRKSKRGSDVMVSFTEDPKIRAEVVKLLNKGSRAQHHHFKYQYAVKCCVKALNLLNEAKYPEDHPTMVRTVEALNSAHHALSSYDNSANIVKIGIRCEDSGDLVRALKMYTIAYRIRRDNLSRSHPSLVVLLNILGSIQRKRGELKEAMQVFELALKEAPPDDVDPHVETKPTGNLIANSVTYREIGGIHEKLGNEKQAVAMYHKSLDCATAWRASRGLTPSTSESQKVDSAAPNFSLDSIHFTRSSQPKGDPFEDDAGGMELFIGPANLENVALSGDQSITDFYNSFFPPYDDNEKRESCLATDQSDKQMDLDITLTLHQIAQMYRRQGDYGLALDAYGAALRGMKHALGPYHPNVAAILGNTGNLLLKMGDLDNAYDTYQAVLGIESYRLGFSHPEVAVSIHNIATIEVARGNYDHALTLYTRVLALQKKLYGDRHPSVAVTASCMGDVYEKLGDIYTAMDFYEKAFKILTAVHGRHHLEVARMLHKMGKIAFAQRDYNLADSYISRAFLLYRMNKLGEDHAWVVDAYKDGADIDAALVLGGGENFEC